MISYGDHWPGPSPSTGRTDITSHSGVNWKRPRGRSWMLKFLAWTSGATRRSKHSTTNTRCRPKVAIRGSATANPWAFSNCRQPFVVDGSAEVRPPPAHQSERQLDDVARRLSALRYEPLPLPPQESRLLLHTGQRNAEIRMSVPPCGETVSIKCRSMSSSDNGTPSIRSKPSGSSSCPNSYTAPTQSRPTAASRSNCSIDPVLNRSATRRRMASLSGSRLSK